MSGGFKSADGASTGSSKEPQGSTINLPRIKGTYYEATVPDTLDLAERAHLGISHFLDLISEENDYEMYWGVQRWTYTQESSEFLRYRSSRDWGGMFNTYNPPINIFQFSVLMACQAKAMEAMAMLRVMSGSQRKLEREAKMLEMMASHIGEDGLHYVPQTSGRKPWLGPEEIRPYAHTHGQARMMRAMVAWYQYTGHPAWKELIDRMVEGMDRQWVVHKDDYAYVPIHGWITHEYFRSCYLKGRGWKDTAEPADEKHGEEGSLFCHQGHTPGVLANWYLLTGNKQALRLSGELVRFYTKPKFWADSKGGDYPGTVGAEHAHWTGHFHGYINVLRATLEYAIATNDARLKAFVRDGYEWARQAGFSRIGLVGDAQGCGCGRLIGLATKLTYAGVGDYWEDVDQYIRNQGVEMQFTPDDIPYLKKLGEGKPAPPEHPSMTRVGVIEATVGGYANNDLPFKNSSGLCCCPHGNMGLFYAWDGTLRYSEGRAQVNLLLNRASPWMDIDSYIPYEGKVVLRNKTAREALVRIPLYVNMSAVECRIGDRKVQPEWFGRYLRLGHLKAGDVVTIEFPVEETIEHWTAPPQGPYLLPLPGGTRYTCKFKGNTLIEISPPLAPGSWLYQQRPQQYRAGQAPIKKVTRFVSPLVLRW